MEETTKPQSNRTVRIINSPIFIWLLSALFLAFGGAYVTQYQQCSREADRLRNQYYHLAGEIYIRQERVAAAVEGAASIDDIKLALKSLPSLYADLKDRSLFELNREFRQIEARIERSPELQDFTRQALAETSYSFNEVTNYSRLSVGLLPRNITDADLAPLKDFIRRSSIAYENDRILSNFTKLSPRCSMVNVISFALNGEGRLLIGNPLFMPDDRNWTSVKRQF